MAAGLRVNRRGKIAREIVSVAAGAQGESERKLQCNLGLADGSSILTRDASHHHGWFGRCN